MPEPGLRIAVLVRDPLERALVAQVLDASGHDVTSGAVLDALTERYDLVVLDLALEGARLEDTVPRLLASGARVLVLSARGMSDRLMVALLSGASGHVRLDDSAPEHLVQAVLAVASGGAALNPLVAAAVLEHWRGQRAGSSVGRADALSDREREVLAAVATGLTTRAVANRLGLSPRTVENHKARIFAKLGAKNQAQAVALALDRGLIDG